MDNVCSVFFRVGKPDHLHFIRLYKVKLNEVYQDVLILYTFRVIFRGA